jgi:heme exporter protein D
MNQLSNWLAMGGYSIYVWPAYGLVVMVLVMNCLGIKKQRKQTHRVLQRWYQHREHGQETNQV